MFSTKSVQQASGGEVTPVKEAGPLTHETRLPSLAVEPGEPRVAEAVTSRIEAMLESLYPTVDVAPFHNVGHARETRDHALRFAARAREYGVDVDCVALEQAALLHDARYDIAPSSMGLPSREDVHAFFAYNVLRSEGADDRHALKVARIIMGTNSMIEPQSIEEKILRAADLFGFSEPYDVFREGGQRLYQEMYSLGGVMEPVPYSEFARKQLSYLSLYLWPALDITPSYNNPRGQSGWHEGALTNLIGLFRAEVCPAGKVVADLTGDLTDKVWREALGGDSLVVRVHRDQSVREAMLADMRSVAEGITPKPPVFVVPGGPEGSPLPRASCDIVITKGGALSAEAQRVLAPGGRVLAAV